MNSVSFYLYWLWFLAAALLIPVSLPAGGVQKNNLKIHSREYSAPFVSSNYCQLLSSPSLKASNIRTLQIGTPMRILRVWEGNDGKKWVHVQITSLDNLELTNGVRRGWLST